jgi:hypothetical protein
MSIAEMSKTGCYIGAAIALVPAGVTVLIASSRAILITVIANAIIRTLSAGELGVEMYGLSLIEVPFLWKASLISATIGGGIIALSLTVALANEIYLQLFKQAKAH